MLPKLLLLKKMTSNYSPTIHFSLVYCVSTCAPLGRAGAGVHIQTVMQANEWTSVATSSYIQTMIHVTSQTTSIITATKESYKIMLFHIMTDILHFIMIELCHRVSYFRSGFPFDRKGFRQSMVEILLDSVFDGTMLQESY